MQKFKLLDGTLSGDEAEIVLLSLVKSKIDFHSKEKLSNEERFGRDISASESRLAELRLLHDTLRTLCQGAAKNGHQLRVAGWLEVDLAPTPKGQTSTASTAALETSNLARV